MVADGNVDERQAVCRTLASAGHRPVDVSTGVEAMRAVHRELPALVILDVALEELSGYAVCHELKQETAGALPVILTSAERTDPLDRVAGLLIGADEYVVKPFDPDEFVVRVRRLIQRSTPAIGRPDSLLTPREIQIVRLLADGVDQREIAQLLEISPKTVGTHIEHVLAKLGARSRAQAIAIAFRTGLVDVRGPAQGSPGWPDDRRAPTRPFVRQRDAAESS